MEESVTKPLHLEKIKDFQADAPLIGVAVDLRETKCGGEGVARVCRWYGPGDLAEQLTEVKCVYCVFHTNSPPGVRIAGPLLPNAQWMSQRGSVSWITEQLDVRTGIRHWA